MIVKRFPWLAGLLCLVTQGVVAAPASADLGDLVTMIDDARTKFQPVTADNVASAKTTVRDRLIEVDQALKNGQTWRDYLMWDKQFREFDRNEAASVELWHLVHARVARDENPFEWDVFQHYRRALRSLIHQIAAHNNSDLEADYQAVLTELAALLSRSDERLTLANTARVSELLTKLNRQQQVPELVASIRELAPGPNLIMEIPAAVLSTDQHFQEDYTFQTVIRGTRVRGSGTLQADQSFSLGAGQNAITVQSVIKGTSNSSSLGYGNGATVRSTGTLNFNAASNVFVNIAGVTASGFDTTGTLRTAIRGISVNYRRQRAATTARQAVYNRQEADRRAAQSQALADLDSTFDKRLRELITPLQAAYRQNLYLPLLRHDRLPHESVFMSSGDRATMQFWFAGEAQLAATSDPPWSEDAGQQVRISIHETAINNNSALLEGRVRSLVSVLNGKFLEYIAETSRPSERIDIRFHDEVAVRGILRDGSLELRLVGTEYVIDGSTYPGMEIILRYRLDNETSTVLRLSEPPQVVSHVSAGVEPPRLGVRGITLRRILSNSLQEHTLHTIDLTEIVLPEPFAQLGKLQTQRIDIQDGWFILEALPLAAGAEGTPRTRTETE